MYAGRCWCECAWLRVAALVTGCDLGGNRFGLCVGPLTNHHVAACVIECMAELRWRDRLFKSRQVGVNNLHQHRCVDNLCGLRVHYCHVMTNHMQLAGKCCGQIRVFEGIIHQTACIKFGEVEKVEQRRKQ